MQIVVCCLFLSLRHMKEPGQSWSVSITETSETASGKLMNLNNTNENTSTSPPCILIHIYFKRTDTNTRNICCWRCCFCAFCLKTLFSVFYLCCLLLYCGCSTRSLTHTRFFCSLALSESCKQNRVIFWMINISCLPVLPSPIYQK